MLMPVFDHRLRGKSKLEVDVVERHQIQNIDQLEKPIYCVATPIVYEFPNNLVSTRRANLFDHISNCQEEVVKDKDAFSDLLLDEVGIQKAVDSFVQGMSVGN